MNNNFNYIGNIDNFTNSQVFPTDYYKVYDLLLKINKVIVNEKNAKEELFCIRNKWYYEMYSLYLKFPKFEDMMLDSYELTMIEKIWGNSIIIESSEIAITKFYFSNPNFFVASNTYDDNIEIFEFSDILFVYKTIVEKPLLIEPRTIKVINTTADIYFEFEK